MANKVPAWDFVSRCIWDLNMGMGKGLSQLQKDVLAVLDDYPPLEDFPRPGEHSLERWARPKQILASLRREPTPSNRAAVSKALDRLYERGLVEKADAWRMMVGNSKFYVRIRDPKNA